MDSGNRQESLMMATRQEGMNNSNNDFSLCVITPAKFDGCSSSSWDDWINQFESEELQVN